MNLDWYGADIFKIKSQVVSCSCSCLQNIICTYKQRDSLGGNVFNRRACFNVHVIIFENQVVVHITLYKSSDLNTHSSILPSSKTAKKSIFNWSEYVMDQ